MYWLSSNVFSLCQVACLRIPAVRTVLKLPQRVVHDPDKLPPREGFLKSFKKGKGIGQRVSEYLSPHKPEAEARLHYRVTQAT